ncbi:hypothetical protein D3C80_1429130 [compost metagenome]
MSDGVTPAFSANTLRSADKSKPSVANPFAASVCAMPSPILPRPTTPITGFSCSDIPHLHFYQTGRGQSKFNGGKLAPMGGSA